jgi:plasmid stabilization system protein ParE
MPEWSRKDERQYEHIKESARERGASTDRAQEIAARTVNKQRREEGRTPNRTTQGTGNPNRSYEERSVRELRNIASERNIEGRRRMNMEELIRALRR